MKIYPYLFHCLSLLLVTDAFGQQNIPSSTGLPSGPYNGRTNYPLNFNQSPNLTPGLYNYDRVFTPLTPMTTIPAFDYTGSSAILVNTTYKNGWGDPILNINRTNLVHDIVTPVDNRVRGNGLKVGYLPYNRPQSSKFQNDAYTKQRESYATSFPNEDTTAYTKSTSYSSSGVLVEENYMPGKAFVGIQKGSITTSHANGSTELSSAGALMNLAYTSGNICVVGNINYSPGKLLAELTDGANGQKSLKYTDNQGKVICVKEYDGTNWLATYYMYNELNQLIYIVPPKAVEELAGTSGCMTSPIEQLCFTYQYDMYGNVVRTTTPGKNGYDINVYDTYNRAVLKQSPLMHTNSEWYFNLYDKLGRICVAGIYHGSDTSVYWDSVARGATAVSRPLSATQTVDYWLSHDLGNNIYPDTLYNCTILTYNYYDDYIDSLGNVDSFSTVFTASYLSGNQNEIPAPSRLVYGKLIANKTRILSDGISNNFTNTKWITSVFYYDEKGRIIQTKTRNPWNTSNWDITASQYNFAGKEALRMQKHYSWGACVYPSIKILTKYNYNWKSGVLESVEQKIDTFVWKPISSYVYDVFGRVSQKTLGNVEAQNYTYNIRGQLTGINSGNLYGTLPSNVTYASKLCYETDFDSIRYDGSLTGYKWRSTSSKAQAYGYVYDKANRLVQADYREDSLTSGSSHIWQKTSHDFSVSNLTYDANGNILSMKQRGYDNTYTPATIDTLKYTYTNGNQLQKVQDWGATSTGIQDFDNTNTGSNVDYAYDDNGNLVADSNKHIQSIVYNFMDAPVKVKKAGDSITYIYDASGRLLQKTIKEDTTTTKWRYWNNLVYRNDTLLYVLHDEGRARMLYDSSKFRYDFFIKDHLGNVRTVVTADAYLGKHYTFVAGFELAYANLEEAVFDQIEPIREINPSGTTEDIMSGRLNGSESDKRIGAAILIHAMAGDQINLHGFGYYESDDTSAMNTYAPAEDMADALATTLKSAAGVDAPESSLTSLAIDAMLDPSNYNIYENIKNAATDPNYPRAYLNCIVFNESMEIVEDACRVKQLHGAANDWQIMQWDGPLVMPANGYAALFFSNESAMDVSVNDEYVTHYKGRMLEEQHYYPHGLVIEGGQSTPGALDRYLTSGNRLQPEMGLMLFDFHARNYDQQIGRFTGVDPIPTEGQEKFNPFQYCANNPGNMIDPLGKKPKGFSPDAEMSKLQAQIEYENSERKQLAFKTDQMVYTKWHSEISASLEGMLLRGLIFGFRNGGAGTNIKYVVRTHLGSAGGKDSEKKKSIAEKAEEVNTKIGLKFGGAVNWLLGGAYKKADKFLHVSDKEHFSYEGLGFYTKGIPCMMTTTAGLSLILSAPVTASGWASIQAAGGTVRTGEIIFECVQFMSSAYDISGLNSNSSFSIGINLFNNSIDGLNGVVFGKPWSFFNFGLDMNMKLYDYYLNPYKK